MKIIISDGSMVRAIQNLGDTATIQVIADDDKRVIIAETKYLVWSIGVSEVSKDENNL